MLWWLINFLLLCCPFALLSIHPLVFASLYFFVLIFPLVFPMFRWSFCIHLSCSASLDPKHQCPLGFLLLQPCFLYPWSSDRIFLPESFKGFLLFQCILSHALILLHNLYLLLSIVWISSLAFLQYSSLFFRIGLNPLLCWSRSWEFLFLLFFGCFRDQKVDIFCYLKYVNKVLVSVEVYK